MIKAAFFDVDGVLSSPHYMHDGKLKVGLPFDEWQPFCDRWKEEAYRDCKPIGVVRDYVEKRRNEGAATYVLSTSHSENECAAKRHFIEMHYAGLFDELYFVPEDAEKLRLIKRYATGHDLPLEDCELVEDTYLTLLIANEAGVTATHLANLLA